MTAPQDSSVFTVQSKTAPLEANDEVMRVGWEADHGNNEDVLGRPAGYIVPAEDRKPVVTDWTGMNDWVNAPPNYETFFAQYAGWFRTLLLRGGAHPGDVYDMAQELMIRFMERDSLGVFTPYWGSKSKTRKSNFRSYVSRFIVTYAAGQKRNFTKVRVRNVAILDAPLDEDGTTYGDIYGEPHYDNLAALEFYDAVASLRDQVSSEVVDAVLALASDGRPVRQTALAKRLGVSPPTARAHLETVRAALADCLSG